MDSPEARGVAALWHRLGGGWQGPKDVFRGYPYQRASGSEAQLGVWLGPRLHGDEKVPGWRPVCETAPKLSPSPR